MRDAEPICIEIGLTSLRLLRGEQCLELPLERTPEGRITAACRAQLAPEVQKFLGRHNWQSRVKAYCAVSARGVSFRRVALPRTPGAKLDELLRLQIEAEFPLPPDQLAWGTVSLPGVTADGKSELLVVAVKKEVLADYATLLNQCGVEPVFTLASLARIALKPHRGTAFATLDVGEQHSELVTYADGVPVAARILPWSARGMAEAVATNLGINQQEANRLLAEFDVNTPGTTNRRIQDALEKALDSLVGLLNGGQLAGTIYLSGQTLRNGSLAGLLAKRPGVRSLCEMLASAHGGGTSAAVLGLLKLAAGGPGSVLEIRFQPKGEVGATAAKAPWKLMKVAAALALGALLLPYVEVFLFKSHLRKQIAALKAEKPRLEIIDREYDFLRSLKQDQPPYLDALYLFSKVAPAGTRIESVSMNRNGDVALKLSLRDGQQVGDFRKQLMDSGLYAGVVIDDQTPSPDRQKLNIRISAHWKPLSALSGLALGPTAEEIEKARNAKRDAPAGVPGVPPRVMSAMPGMPPEMVGVPAGVSLPPDAVGGARARGAPSPAPSPVESKQ